MKKTIILSLLPLLFLPAAAQLPDASEIMSKSRDLTITGSMRSDISLTITEKAGSVRKRTISMVTKSYTDGTEKRLIKFIEPADVKGTTLLVVDNKNSPDDMWIYLPALKKTRRIVSTEKGKSFMSSEFSNSDMSSPALADFAYKHLASSGENKLWIIESLPVNNEKADEYGYSKKISYFSSDNWQIKKMEYYNFDNQIYKIIEVKGIQPLVDGRYVIKNMSAKNISNGRSSDIFLDKIVINTKIEDSVFSLQNLER
ncbi:MAG: RND transporter [Odoribacter sp.]|nr:RND transporter [Odoribacter sp.]